VQIVVTGSHAVPLFSVLKVLPATHAMHVRSTVVLPSSVFPVPTAHVCQAEQVSTSTLFVLAAALNVNAPHSVQARSELTVAAVLK